MKQRAPLGHPPIHRRPVRKAELRLMKAGQKLASMKRAQQTTVPLLGAILMLLVGFAGGWLAHIKTVAEAVAR